MNYIPKSRVGRGLLLTLVSSTAYFSYDRYQYMIINQELEKKFKVFGSLPIKPGDPSDKLKIYIAPSFYAMNWFNSYIRPFLFIGGMDYELVQKELDQIQEDVVNTIKNTRERWITQTVKIRDRTWIEYFRGIDAPTKDILKVQNEFKGIVGVGPEVYDLVLAGYDHGVHCIKESHVEDCTNSENLENLEKLEPSRITATVEDYKNYPTLFHLPGKEQTGWRGFPKRIFWAFNQRWILQQVGDELVEIFKKVE